MPLRTESRPGLRPLLPLVAVSGWWAVLMSIPGALKPDHLYLGGTVLVLSWWGPRSRILLRFLAPAVATVVIYDGMRHFADAIRSTRIRVSEPYHFDLRFFGIRSAGRTLTPTEWWQEHTHWLLDLYTGFFYIAFVGIFIAIALYFRFALEAKHRSRAETILWAFLWLNLLGYSTYYWYPAAPPWYVTLHGLGPADLSVRPNPAGAIRFDELMGTQVFQKMYSRSADVFGAIPSLHVAYPLLSVLYAFEFSRLRALSVLFYLSMCFSAVYLNHHYVIDILWGSAYTLIIYALVRIGSDRARTPEGHPSTPGAIH